jgi:glycosyltransferase involved in cell wall biosynthesis
MPMKAKVSVGIPVYNEEKNIDKMLKFFYKKKFLFDLIEMIIVCSGCTDRSVDIVRKWSSKDDRIKLIIEKRREGKSSAMDKILKLSTGNYIIFIDADIILKRNTLDLLVKPLENPYVGTVIGRAIPTQSGFGVVDYFQELVWNLHHDICFSFRKIGGNIFSIRKSLIHRIPSKIINDDAYIAAQIPKSYVIFYEPKAESFMTEKVNLSGWINKRRRIAQGFIQLSKCGMNVSVPLHIILKNIIKEIIKNPRKFFHIVLAVLVEIYCNILAFYDIERGKLDYKWDKCDE